MRDFANLLRPKTLDDFVGQEHLIAQFRAMLGEEAPSKTDSGETAALTTETAARNDDKEIAALRATRSARNDDSTESNAAGTIHDDSTESTAHDSKESDQPKNPKKPAQKTPKPRLCHCFFYGAPGVGKTTMANIIAKKLDAPIGFFNATHFKLDDLRKFVAAYAHALTTPLLVIDEVHRLSRTQQEALLPIMEHYEAFVIGTSTLNPYFTLTNAIRSRSFLFEFRPLSRENLAQIVRRAESKFDIKYPPEVADYAISTSGGDVRALLNLLDVLADHGAANITLGLAKSLRPYSIGEGSSEDDTHYNLISALIKSVRGSDENAALYYLARLINAGENPEFIARRMVILASEDIGNANPNALNLATSTMLAVAKIGYPEARIILSQCVIYLASCPKSNTAYTAIEAALEHVTKKPPLDIPAHILPNGPGTKDYKYPHDFGGWVAQKYIEIPLKFVAKTAKGFEKTLNDWLTKIRGR